MDSYSKGKSMFDQMMDALTARDEKAALESAKKLIAEMEQKIADAEQKAYLNAQRADSLEKRVSELQEMLTKTQADHAAILSKTQAELQALKASANLLEQRALSAEARVKEFEDARLLAQQQVAALEAAKAKILTTHTLTAKETLSDLALKYYGHATPPYWGLIYEANKDVIGPNPNAVRPGLVIQIPVLPDHMKK